MVDPNGHDPNKKIDRGPTVFTKTEFQGREKGESISKTGILQRSRYLLLKMGANLVGGKYSEVRANGGYPSENGGYPSANGGYPSIRLRDLRPLPKSNLQYFQIVAVF
jgi:hypothetical protein